MFICRYGSNHSTSVQRQLVRAQAKTLCYAYMREYVRGVAFVWQSPYRAYVEAQKHV